MARVIDAQIPGAAWATMSWRSLMNVALVGALVGLTTYALYSLLLRFVFEPILCGEADALVRCGSQDGFASSIAIVLGSMIGLIFIVRERTFRPLLVVLASALALWGLFIVVVALPWLAAVAVTTVTFAVAYALFAWLAQPASLTVALVVITIVIVASRLVLNI